MDKWILNYGVHRHTLTSRDSSHNEYDSKQKAMDFLREEKQWLASIGYVIWFAELVAPDGTKTMLEQDGSY